MAPPLLVAFCLLLGAGDGLSAPDRSPDKTALLTPSQVTSQRLAELKRDGFTGVALILSTETLPDLSGANRLVKEMGLPLDYWIEVARNPALADEHPDWLASVQTHSEWRRNHPGFPALKSNEVVKVYPWVPVAYQESFPVHLLRVKSLLHGQPRPRRLFLNDLQGAPNACGCGHDLCRWTTDYGPITTATRLAGDAAAKFVSAVQLAVPDVEVIPVWLTECEAEDKESLCGGVGCYEGACWREWTAQLAPVTRVASTIGVLATYKSLQRDLPVYGEPGSWVARAVGYFDSMPARYDARGVASNRLLPIVQGWDVTKAEHDSQIQQARQVGAKGVVVAYTPIEQSWRPLIHRPK